MFTTEEKMVKKFLSFSFYDDIPCFFEFGVGYGIADVIYCNINKEVFEERVKNGPHSIIKDKNSIRVIDFLCLNKKSDLSTMMDQLYFNKRNLKYNILKRLINNGFVKEIDKEVYSLRFNYRPLVSEIIAIEAKLKDWKAGYMQARRYLHFAHQSYLAIDKDFKHRVREEILLRDNIGLLSVDEKGVDLEYYAKTSTPKDKHMFLLANEKIFSLILNGEYHLSYKTELNFACVV